MAARLGRRQALQCDAGQVTTAGQSAQGCHQGTAGGHLVLTVRHREQQTGLPVMGGHELHQLQRGRVGPMHVINHDDQRGRDAQAGNEPPHGLSQAEASRHRLNDGGRYERVDHFLELGNDLRQVAHGRRRSVAHDSRVDDAHQVAQHLDPRPHGRRSFSLMALAPCDNCAPLDSHGSEFLGQPGLTDAGLSGKQHDRTGAGNDSVQSRREGSPRPLTSDKGRNRRYKGRHVGAVATKSRRVT